MPIGLQLIGRPFGDETGVMTAGPDLSGLWNRVGNLWLDPILDDDGGKPVSRLKVDRPGAEDIWAGDFNNPTTAYWRTTSRLQEPHRDCISLRPRSAIWAT
jgi:hypothetical protein